MTPEFVGWMLFPGSRPCSRAIYDQNLMKGMGTFMSLSNGIAYEPEFHIYTRVIDPELGKMGCFNVHDALLSEKVII